MPNGSLYKWSRAARAPKAAERLILRISQFEALVGREVSSAEAVKLSSEVGLSISEDEAQELLDLRLKKEYF